MKKYVLREMGLLSIDKTANSMKKFLIVLLWLILTISMIAGTFLALIAIVKFLYPHDPTLDSPIAVDIIWDENMRWLQIIELIAAFLLYLVLKSAITALFCVDSKNSIATKFIDDGAPSNYCREGLKVWQTILIYFVPFFIIYAVMFGICIAMDAEGGFMTMLFIMIPFMAFDLELVLYVLILKARYKMSYIAVNSHIYNFTAI